jgi:hypothetical protein
LGDGLTEAVDTTTPAGRDQRAMLQGTNPCGSRGAHSIAITKLFEDPNAYGWFQLQMVMLAYEASAPMLISGRVCDFGCLEAAIHDRPQRVYSVEKLISCAQTILQINHSVAENQA